MGTTITDFLSRQKSYPQVLIGGMGKAPEVCDDSPLGRFTLPLFHGQEVSVNARNGRFLIFALSCRN